ncbi:MAG: hypothetical protein PHD26_03815 [Methanosarcinaceae archaeon]|nr:hypothetical protein [Methanosarcinaceae archaeon]MDD4749060.1 hypothetical protein [Methanosarcinaceae archaeon]
MDPLENLIDQPAKKRYTIISSRIRYIAYISDEAKRIRVTQEVLETVMKLPKEERKIVYRTAVDAVESLLKEKKRIFLETLKKVVIKWPISRKMEEKRVLATAIRDLPQVKQALIRGAYRKLLF